jgi:hypothetical protein
MGAALLISKCWHAVRSIKPLINEILEWVLAAPAVAPVVKLPKRLGSNSDLLGPFLYVRARGDGNSIGKAERKRCDTFRPAASSTCLALQRNTRYGRKLYD